MAVAPHRVYHWKHGWIPLDSTALALRVSKPANPTAPVRGLDDLSPLLQRKIGDKLTALTGLPEPVLAAKVQANLKRLYAAGDASKKDWYAKEGGDIAARAAAIRKETGSKVTAEQLTGMVAVTSAHKRWLENKDFAEAVARKLAADEPFEVTPRAIEDYNTWVGKRAHGLAALHPDLKPGIHRPSELPTDFAVSKTPGMPRHLNTDFVIQAARIYRGESTVDEAVNGPKQRSFVNNLLDPDDTRSATVDTWHYRAAMAGIPLTREVGPKGNKRTYSYTLEQWDDRDLTVTDGRAAAFGYDPAKGRYDHDNVLATIKAADSVKPQQFFQGGPASVADGYSGNSGTYPWFVKQTQIAAEQLGVTPNALQAVAWYAVGGGQ